MSFETTYQLMAPVADSAEALSYRAMMKLTGEEVWIHIVRPDSKDIFDLAKKQFAAAHFGERPILEVVQDGAKAYIVTKPLPPNAALRDWLQSLGQAVTPDPFARAGSWKAAGPEDPPTMQMPELRAGPPAAAPPPYVPPPLAPPPVAQGAGPGEFTQLFRAAPMPAPSAPQVQAPGEFTRMFKAPAQVPQAAPPSAQAAPAQESDEFARMFQSPLIDHTPAPVNPITHPIAPPPSRKEGEFTRMFKAIDAPSVMRPPMQAPPPGPAQGPGDFTRLLKAHTPGEGPPMVPASATPPPGQAFPSPAPQATPSASGPPPPAASPAYTANAYTPSAAPSSFNPPPVGAPPPQQGQGSQGQSKVSVGGPSFSGPSVGIPGLSGPSVSSSGINGPHMNMPTFSPGSMSGPYVAGPSSFSLDNLPGFGGSSTAAPDVSQPQAGPLSASSAPMNPNALSKGDGATGFFKSPQQPARQAPPPPAQSGPGEFTRIMKAPPVASAPAVGVPLPSSHAPLPGPAPLFSQPVTGPPATAPVPAPAPQKPGGFLKTMSPWLIAGYAAILLMIGLLVYVVVTTSR